MRIVCECDMPRRPSYASIASTLALVLALSGTAYAATQLPKNSVGAKQIQKNAVSGKKVKDGSLKSADLEASTLAGFRKGRDLRGQGTFSDAQEHTLVTIPGLGRVAATCLVSPGPSVGINVRVTNSSTAPWDGVVLTSDEASGDEETFGQSIVPGNTFVLSHDFPGSASGAVGRYLRFTVVNGPVMDIEVFAFTNRDGDGTCSARAHVTLG